MTLDTLMDKIYKHRYLNNILDKIKEWSCAYSHYEICGFVGFCEKEKKYILKFEENAAADPKQFFSISALSYLLFKDQYNLMAVFHSHIIVDEEPSEFDIKMSENCCIPFLIYALNNNKFGYHIPGYCDVNNKLIKKIQKSIKQLNNPEL
jgi:proteasome lid subunit RPN8/RPN11